MARRITKNEWCNIHVELEEGIYEDARMVWVRSRAGWDVNKPVQLLHLSTMVRPTYSKPRDGLITNSRPVDVQRVQDSDRPDGHRRAQKRSVHHGCPQIRGPVRLIRYNSHL